MTPQEMFIARLRRHRERHAISLDDIVRETRIKREQLEAFENGDLTVWPNGLYARAWIRGYATVVGLDPTDTVDEFCRLFPQGDRRAASTLREFAEIVSHSSAYADEFDASSHEDRRKRAPEAVPEAPPAPTWREYFFRLMRSLRPTRAARAVRTLQ